MKNLKLTTTINMINIHLITIVDIFLPEKIKLYSKGNYDILCICEQTKKSNSDEGFPTQIDYIYFYFFLLAKLINL